MGDLLNIGISGLLAFKRTLDTTGHNIANVNTAGYTRQRVDLTARAGQSSDYGFIGSGVQVAGINRLQDRFVFDQVLQAGTEEARLRRLSELSGQVDSLLSDPATSLAAPLQNYFDALQGVAADPLSTAARQTLLARAEDLTTRAGLLGEQLDAMEAEINGQFQQRAAEITDQLQQLAQINQQIVAAAGAAGGHPPNDLLDQRDRMLTELAGWLGIATTIQDDGSVNVFTPNGQTLVIGNRASTVTAVPDDYATGRLVLGLDSAAGIQPLKNVTGGELGALSDFRREVLDPTRARLGRVVAGLALASNEQQAAGVDLNGQRGSPLFSIPSAYVYPNLNNTGSASLSVALDDASALRAEDYLLQYDGSSWSARGVQTGANLPMTGSGTLADPYRLGGVSVVLSGSAAAGDRFLLQPTDALLGGLGVALTNPAGVAAAFPIRTAAAVSNLGSGQIDSGRVTNADNPLLGTPVTLQFIDASNYSINGSGSYAYVPGAAIALNGWEVTLSGAPQAGDQFTITPAPPGSGDNRNAQAIAALSSKGVLDGGSASVSASYSALIAQVGSQARSNGIQLGAQTAIMDELQGRMNAASGVNLDEEAANLVRFQQAYQAAAQVIATADLIFQSLLSAVRSN